MTKFEVNEDCYCESEAHETLFYNSNNATKKLKKGDIVTFVVTWMSYFNGEWLIRVTKDNVYYDIYPKYLNIIS